MGETEICRLKAYVDDITRLSYLGQAISALLVTDKAAEVVEFLESEEVKKTLASREIAGARRYFLQVFADRESVPRRDLTAPSREDLLRYLSAVRRAVPEAQLRGI